MTTRLLSPLVALLAAAVLPGTVSGVYAQAPAAAAATPAPGTEHPAYKVVQEYLEMVLTRQWSKGKGVVDEDSLKVAMEDYLRAIKRAPTIEAEEGMIRRVGKATIEEVMAMSPRDWYIAYNSSMKEIPPEMLTEMRRTIKLKPLSAAEDESAKLAFFLVKADFENGENHYERYDMITLRNKDGKWMVLLDGMPPKITPLKPGAVPATPPAADPLGPGPKPAPKPAAKPAAKPATKPATPVKPKKPA